MGDISFNDDDPMTNDQQSTVFILTDKTSFTVFVHDGQHRERRFFLIISPNLK